MNNKKVIIFDFDGVIVDSFDHSYQRGIRQWPELQPHEYKDFFKGNVFDGMAKMPPSQADDDEMQQWLREEYFPRKRGLPLFEGIETVLEQLEKKYTLVINTSSMEEEVKSYLDNNNLHKYIDAIYGSEKSKNKVEKFKQIFQDYSINKEGCIFVTDTIGDVLEARQCNIGTIAVTYGYHDRSYFEPVVDSVIGFANQPSEILALVTI